MGKRDNQASKFNWDELSEGEGELANGKALKSVAMISSDDEANEDFSLKIVEKALLMRAAKLAPENDSAASDLDGLIGQVSSSSPWVPEVAAAGLETKKLVKKGKVRKIKKRKIEDPAVNFAQEEVKVDEGRVVDETIELSNVQITKEEVTVDEARAVDVTIEPNTIKPNIAQISDNIVLRKLLRGPRYFDPPDKSWGACFNCGEDGHAAVNCTVAKRKKPCFVCGSLEHNVKQCEKGKDCFICKKGGHQAKNCPEKYNVTSKICLKCGDTGHEMYSCKNDYSSDDLKEIQCYVCRKLGHLCCVKCGDNSVKKVSCYRCGQLGHTGMACIGFRAGETMVPETPLSCYRCGEGGHIARHCKTSNKAHKRDDEFSNVSTPTVRPHREKKDYMGFYSVPNDLNNNKRKHTYYDDRGFATPQKAKSRGGWIVDDPDDFSPKKGKKNGWKSPSTPTSRSHKIPSSTAGSYASSSRSSKKLWKVNGGTPISQGSSMPVHHRYSAQRFNNSGNDGMGRNNGWW